MTTNELIRDRVIGHAYYLERYTKTDLTKMLELVEKANQATLFELSKLSGGEGASVQRSLLNNIRSSYASTISEIEKQLTLYGKALAANEHTFTHSLLSESPIKLSLTLVTPEMLWVAVQDLPVADGTLFGELFKAYSEGTTQKIVSTIRAGFIEGKSVPDIMRMLRGTRASGYTDGVMNATRQGAEALTRTVINHISNTVAMETYKANPDLVKAVQFLATLDNVTCEICGELDGKVWPIDEQHETPPMHINCRCAITPVLASWEELGLDASEIPEDARRSMNGVEPGTSTYADWLGRQSTVMQNDILGTKRADLFRSGTTLTNMVKDGKLMTLEELGVKPSKNA